MAKDMTEQGDLFYEGRYMEADLAIQSERAYQDHHYSGMHVTLEGEIILLRNYVEKLGRKWQIKSCSMATLMGEMRKIAAIAHRCLENHEAPKRYYTR